VKKRLTLEWVLDMPVLAMLGDPDDEPVDEIRGGIDYGLDEGPPLDSLVGFASMKDWGGFATQDCKFARRVHWIAS
jgi:hypothetical protein